MASRDSHPLKPYGGSGGAQRRWSAACVLPLLLWSQAARPEPSTRPSRNEPFHESTPGRIKLDDLGLARRQRVQWLWKNLICACPKENWSRTLDNCKDACADPQKERIIAAVASGATDDEILADQQRDYGPKVLAGGDAWSRVLPFVALGAGAVIVFIVLARWRRAAPARRKGRPQATAREVRAIERELAEIE